MLHVTTTPCVSYAVSEGDFDFGIMISASHNPFYDNGIKIVNSKGEKLDEKTVEQIERYLEGEVGEPPFATGAEIGEIVDYVAGRNRYVGYLISLSHHSFRGLKIGLDMANGGAWSIAKSVFDALGARTYVINAEPNGLNINLEAGSTHIEGLARLVREQGLDVGFAFDGDADRCIAVDERGQVVSGDGILYILARELLRQGELTGGRVVATVMSNLGLHRALGELGVGCEVTAVGDRYVYEKMVEGGYSLGGEESGHIILSKYATTGDGILTAIKVAEAVVEEKAALS
jgi:phosphoglucosamine mutase